MNKLLFGVCVLLVSSNCFAWDSMGHRVVAEIAYEHLDAQAKQMTNDLIDYLADAYPYSSTFQTASAWADYLKQDDVHAFDNWHFDNLPISIDNAPTRPANSTNLLWAINQCIAILKSAKSNQYEKAFFLRFLLHLVGDASQPLHCADRFSKDYPNGDEGGNLFMTNNGTFENLHAYWDDGLGLFDNYCTASLSKSRQAKCLAAKIESDYPEPSLGTKVNDLNPNDWINESFTLAKNVAYQTPEGKPLSTAYLKQGQPIVEQQLALAGYRLANLLNSIFG
jgi:hypothetical protein